MKIICKNCGQTNYPTTKHLTPCWNCGNIIGTKKALKQWETSPKKEK